MDPRAAQTREALSAAILELAAERPLDAITVTDIVSRADVHRSSLYQHFSDREELLASALEAAETSALRVTAPVRAPSDPDRPPTELLRFLQHFADYADVYRMALGPQGSARVAARVRAQTLELVREGMALTNPEPSPSIPFDIGSAATTGALLAVIEAWLNRDPLPSIDEAARWIWQLLKTGYDRLEA